MNKLELTDQQLDYLQELVMFAYEMEVPEQKGWDIQTYDNLVDEVMKSLTPIIKRDSYVTWRRTGYVTWYVHSV